MTALAARPTSGRWLVPAVAPVLGAVLAVLVVWQPVAAVLGVAGAAAVGAMMLRIEWAVLVYVAAEPFGDYLTGLSSVSVKVVGVILFTAWLLRLAIDTRPVSLRHPAMYAAGGLVLVLLAATATAANGPAGVEVAARYLSYLAVLVVLVDTLRTGLPARRVMAAFVLSCTAAAVVGLVSFLGSGGGRAAGPMRDANDFAFYLAAALPFALLLWRGPGRRRQLWARQLWALAAVLLAVTTLATFSRGAMLGLLAMLLVAGVLRLLRLRPVLLAAAGTAVALLVVVLAAPGLVERSLAEKQHVAAENVSSRFASWAMAAEMTADDPLLGKGPGGFRTHFDDYVGGRVTDTTHLDVVHQMYLDVASELGLLGLGAFLAMLGLAAAGAVRGLRHGDQPELAATVCVALAGTLVAASFLSEQYYLPVWLLVALGVALDPRGAN